MAEIQQRTVLPELPDDIGARCCEEKILPYKTCSNGKTSFSFSFFSFNVFFFFFLTNKSHASLLKIFAEEDIAYSPEIRM